MVADMNEADRLISDFCVLFFRTYPGLVAAHGANTLQYYQQIAQEPGNSFRFTVDRTRMVAITSAEAWGHPNLGAALSTEAYLKLDQDFLHGLYGSFTRAVNDIYLAGVVLFFLGVAAAVRALRPLFFSLAATGAIVGHMLFHAVMLAGLQRYLIPAETLASVALGALLAAIVDSEPARALIRNVRSSGANLLTRQRAGRQSRVWRTASPVDPGCRRWQEGP
jgi:hypothetical protein